MKICQIKGTNGSGKTTIVKQLLSVSQDVRPMYMGETFYATAMDDIGWVAIGRYPAESKMGGCDLLHSVQEIKAAINWAMNARPNYWIVFEGMMISTIKSTFYDYLLELRSYSKTVMPVFVILTTTPMACYKRITARGTMKKDLNMSNVQDKLEGILRHAATYDPAYVRYMNVDRIPLEDMGKEFLRVVGDEELLRLL